MNVLVETNKLVAKKCSCCGAPLNGLKCGYCGVEYLDEAKPNVSSMPSWTGRIRAKILFPSESYEQLYFNTKEIKPVEVLNSEYRNFGKMGYRRMRSL